MGAIAAGAVENIGDEGGIVHTPGGEPIFLRRRAFSFCQGADEVARLAATDLDAGATKMEIDLDVAATICS